MAHEGGRRHAFWYETRRACHLSAKARPPAWSRCDLCVTEIRRRVLDEAAPHDDVRLLVLDRFPCPQDTFAAEAATLGDPLRARVVEMRDELNAHDSMVSKRPLGDEAE